MLKDYASIRRVVLACGTVDLRKGIDGLSMIIGDRYGQNPFENSIPFCLYFIYILFTECSRGQTPNSLVLCCLLVEPVLSPRTASCTLHM